MRCRGAGRGIEADFGSEHADTFRRDLHPDLRADYFLANPPFNDSDWFREGDDVRWQWREATWTTNGSPKGERNQAHQYPSPQRGNANFAWVQHFIHHLAPHGMAGFVLVRFWFWLKSKPAGAIKLSDKATPSALNETDVVKWFSRLLCQLVARLGSN